METADIQWLGLAILSLLWVYVAVRMGGRAVLRTLDEYRQGQDRKDENDGS